MATVKYYSIPESSEPTPESIEAPSLNPDVFDPEIGGGINVDPDNPPPPGEPSPSYFLGWRIGVQNNSNRALWMIEEITLNNDPYIDYAPDATEEIEIEETVDVNSVGYTRTAFPNLTITELLEEFQRSKQLTREALIALS